MRQHYADRIFSTYLIALEKLELLDKIIDRVYKCPKP
jgi:hypothetical protein